MDQDSLPGVPSNNTVTSKEAALLIEGEVDSLIQRGAVVVVVPSYKPVYQLALPIVEKKDKSSLRHVINLKPLNTFI